MFLVRLLHIPILQVPLLQIPLLQVPLSVWFIEFKSMNWCWLLSMSMKNCWLLSMSVNNCCNWACLWTLAANIWHMWWCAGRHRAVICHWSMMTVIWGLCLSSFLLGYVHFMPPFVITIMMWLLPLYLRFCDFITWQEEDEEEMESVFYNELWSLDLDKGKWFPVRLR